jgi:RNA polymerase sigma factor (sigma-70 family)
MTEDFPVLSQTTLWWPSIILITVVVITLIRYPRQAGKQRFVTADMTVDCPHRAARPQAGFARYKNTAPGAPATDPADSGRQEEHRHLDDQAGIWDEGLDESFEAFYMNNYKWAVAKLAPLTGVDYRIAEDAVHDAFIACQRHWPTLRSNTPSTRRNYLLKAARNGVMEHYRKHSRVSCWGSPADLDDISLITADHAPGVADQVAVRRFIERLPERRREVLIAYYYAGMTHEEIADFLGISQSSVRTHLKRARDKLSKELSEAEESGALRIPRRNSQRRKA